MVRASRYDYAPYFSLTGNHHTHTPACDLTLGNHCAAVAAGFIYKTNLAGKSRQLSLIGAPSDAYADVHTMLAVWLGVHARGRRCGCHAACGVAGSPSSICESYGSQVMAYRWDDPFVHADQAGFDWELSPQCYRTRSLPSIVQGGGREPLCLGRTTRDIPHPHVRTHDSQQASEHELTFDDCTSPSRQLAMRSANSVCTHYRIVNPS